MNRLMCFFIVALCFAQSCTQHSAEQAALPRVFIFTDINIDSGDPDDRQSLIHLLWYANELEICGIVPDRWDARGLEACLLVNEAYAQDYEAFKFAAKGYPSPEKTEKLFVPNFNEAMDKFTEAAADTSRPLYVLVWGNMVNFGEALRNQANLSGNIRLITIGSHLMMEEYRQHIPANWETSDEPCKQYNWNGFGRKQMFNDPRFKNMWWLEINWTYEGMFTGNEPVQIFEKLLEFGNMGAHMENVVKNEPWARYFRVGDTPTVLYLIDPNNDLDDPTKGSWAGKFIQPFPETRPNYFTDYSGEIVWDYANPCNTWQNHVAVRDVAKGTLEAKRPEMYKALIEKLASTYNIE
jgi:hypothetical protein